jgi:hypothetical protein
VVLYGHPPQPAGDPPGLQETDQVAAAPAAPATAGNGVGFLAASLIALAVSVFVFYVLAQYGGKVGLAPVAQQGTWLVVLDSNRIVNTAMRRVMTTPGVTPQQASAAGVQMAQRLDGVLGEYRSRGVIVINAAVAVAWPAEADITKQVADRVGVALE